MTDWNAVKFYVAIGANLVHYVHLIIRARREAAFSKVARYGYVTLSLFLALALFAAVGGVPETLFIVGLLVSLTLALVTLFFATQSIGRELKRKLLNRHRVS